MYAFFLFYELCIVYGKDRLMDVIGLINSTKLAARKVNLSSSKIRLICLVSYLALLRKFTLYIALPTFYIVRVLE